MDSEVANGASVASMGFELTAGEFTTMVSPKYLY